MSFSTAKSLARRRIADPVPSHVRTRQVYGSARREAVLGRATEVLLAQLRSGHCRRLRAYRAIMDPSVDPICPRCGEEPEDLYHWFIRCPALSGERMRCFGGVDADLSFLSSEPSQAASFARRSLPP